MNRRIISVSGLSIMLLAGTMAGAIAIGASSTVRADDATSAGASSDASAAAIAQLQAELAKVKKTADQALSNTTSGKASPYVISGYSQVRYEADSSHDTGRFPQGSAHYQSPINGNYGQGGDANSFTLRRGVIAISGAPTANSKFSSAINVTGTVGALGVPTVAATSSKASPYTSSAYPANSTATVTMLDMWTSYTFGNGSSLNPTITVGQFGQVFGYDLGTSGSAILTPERPLPVSNDNSSGIFAGQDYDKGIKVSYGPGKFVGTLAVVNGNGRVQDNIDRLSTFTAHVKYTACPLLNVGVSYISGELNPNYSSTLGDVSVVPNRRLYGLDAEYNNTKSGWIANAEYVAGTYEQRQYFDQAAGDTAGLIYKDVYAPGNQISGYYIQGAKVWNQNTIHAISLIASYDWLNRSEDGISSKTSLLGGRSGNTFVDSDFGFGPSYMLDKQTRVRVFYNQPITVAHAYGSSNPPKIGLLTAEFQWKF